RVVEWLVCRDKGKIVAEGSPRELIERYSTREVTELRFPAGVQETLNGQLEGLAERMELLPDRVLLYCDGGDAALAAAHRRGLRPETVLVRRSSLEDVFLRLTGRSLIEYPDGPDGARRRTARARVSADVPGVAVLVVPEPRPVPRRHGRGARHVRGPV